MIGRDKMYVVINSDLEMSAGKVAAQVAHVVARLGQDPHKVAIVLQGTTDQLRNLREYLDDANIPNSHYIDEGANEVPPMSLTAVAFGGVVEDFTPDFIAGFDLYVDQTPYELEREKFRTEIAQNRAAFYEMQAAEWRKSYMEKGKWAWQR